MYIICVKNMLKMYFIFFVLYGRDLTSIRDKTDLHYISGVKLTLLISFIMWS